MLRVYQTLNHQHTIYRYQAPVVVAVIVDNVDHLKLFHHLIPVTLRRLVSSKESVQRNWSRQDVAKRFPVKEKCVHQRLQVQ